MPHARLLKSSVGGRAPTVTSCATLFSSGPLDARRIARLDRGASSAPELPTWTGDGLKETRERACPHCGKRAIAPRGHVRAVGGVVKAMYLCEDCRRPFVLVLVLLR